MSTRIVVSHAIPGTRERLQLDMLAAALGEALGREVPVVEGMPANGGGAILLVTDRLDEALGPVTAEVRRRTVWISADRLGRSAGAAAHSLAAVFQRFALQVWTREPEVERGVGLLARRDIADRFPGARAGEEEPGDYLTIHDLPYRNLASVLAALIHVMEGAPAPAGDKAPPAFPLQCVLDGGYTIVRCLSGGPDRGLYLAERSGRGDREGGAVLVSLGPAQTIPWEKRRGELELPGEGFAPIAGTAHLMDGETGYDALLEVRPPGSALHELIPGGGLDGKRAARLLIPYVDWVAGAHRRKRVIGTLRPELLFAQLTDRWTGDDVFLPDWGTARPRATGIAPRCERYLLTAGRPDYGFGPAFDQLYQAPELLAMRPFEPASDVFSLGAILDFLVLGEYPFPGDTMGDRLGAVMTGRFERPDGPPSLVDLIDRALSPAATERPTLDAFRRALRSLA